MGGAGLAGRHAELRVVTDTLGGESAAALLVVGEAGIGKSRLLAAATEAVAAEVAAVTGWCLQLSEGRPFLPVVDVLRGMAELDGGRLLKAAFADCPAFVRTDLARLLPELEDTPPPPATTGADDEWRRHRLLEAVRQVVRAAGALRRMAMVIEDVHWADRSTLELLDYLLAPGHETDVPFVISSRTEEAPATGWLERAQRNSRIRRLDLPPLSRAETAEQIELLIGSRPTVEFVDETYRRTAGNAFFTEQLVSARGALPSGLVSLLLSRTAQVSEAARQLLEVLAVAAEPLDEAALAEVSGLTAPEVRQALRDLLSLRLLRDPDAAGRHQLRNALLAEAVAGRLLPGERRELHVRVAELMVDSTDPGAAAQIAQHFAAAGRTAEELHWRVLAGQQAGGVYASAQAADHWRRVIALWDRVTDPGAVAGVDLADVYRWAWTSVENAGDDVAAGELAEEAFARLAASASPQTLVSLYRAVGHFRGIVSLDAGLQALSKAVEIGEHLPPSPAYAVALDTYQDLLQQAGRFRENHEQVIRTLQAAQDIGDLAMQRRQTLELAWLAMTQGNVDEAAARIDDARRLPVDAEVEPETAADTAVAYTDLLLKLGTLDDVVTEGMSALHAAERSGLSSSRAVLTIRTNVTQALIELGDLTRAAALIDPMTDRPPTRDSRKLHWLRAELDMRRGGLAAAAAVWDTNRDLIWPTANLDNRLEAALRHVELMLWCDDPAAAFAEASAILEELSPTGYSRFSGTLFVLALRACADVAERARATADDAAINAARRNGERLRELLAAVNLDPFANVPATARAEALSWQAEWTRLRDEPDPEAWERAAAAWDALPRTDRAAYARWRQAEALLALPYGRAAATPVLQDAASQAIQHVPLSNAIRDLALRARIDLTLSTASPVELPSTATATPFGLTDRELTVLRLLVEGKTNSEIGAALYISRKTASVHVTNILRKLEVATRVQAATVAERTGLLINVAHPAGS
jgi:DNA-binding CsgD family transcriptional regulator